MIAHTDTTMADSTRAERAPCSSCDRASMPLSSVPSQWLDDGGSHWGAWSTASMPTG